jgi:hypothetical protein
MWMDMVHFVFLFYFYFISLFAVVFQFVVRTSGVLIIIILILLIADNIKLRHSLTTQCKFSHGNILIFLRKTLEYFIQNFCMDLYT